jgi:hypothetical protein
LFYDILENVTSSVYFMGSWPLPPQSDIDFFFSIFSDTMSYLNMQLGTKGPDFDMWTLIYNQTWANALDVFVHGPACSVQPPSYATCDNDEYLMNNRDRQMSANIEWFMERKLGSLAGITNRKMIVWTGNSHGAIDTSTIPDSGYQYSYCKGVTPCTILRAGGFVKELYGNRAKLIGSTSYSGYSGSMVTPCMESASYSEYKKPIYGSFEYLMETTDHFPVAAYVDLSSSHSALPNWLATELLAFNYEGPHTSDPSPLVSIVPDLYDGLLYFAVQHGITCLTNA